jgi:hypothetical protein
MFKKYQMWHTLDTESLYSGLNSKGKNASMAVLISNRCNRCKHTSWKKIVTGLLHYKELDLCKELELCISRVSWQKFKTLNFVRWSEIRNLSINGVTFSKLKKKHVDGPLKSQNDALRMHTPSLSTNYT